MMDPFLRELLDLAVRWVHIVAAIMWIGNSLLYNWLDRQLERPEQPKVGGFGMSWLLHSGGFYYVEKTGLKGQGLPPRLHWFKWQAYTTWLSGAALLVLVYYMSGGALLIDSASGLSLWGGIGVSVAALAGGLLIYELITRSPLMRHPAVAAVLGLGLIVGLTLVLEQFLTTRATFLHVGAVLGTVMAANVFLKIMPSQRQLVRSVELGGEADQRLSDQAKTRSIHNNYLTFPVIVLMTAGHFPSFHGGALNWIVMAVLVAGGAGVRHILNVRFHVRRWLPALTAVIVATLAALYLLVALPAGAAAADDPERAELEPVSFEHVQMIVAVRCTVCHSQNPVDRRFGIAPGGVSFDQPQQIRRGAEQIYVQSVATRAMPPANLTDMTDEERTLLGRWIRAGAPVD